VHIIVAVALRVKALHDLGWLHNDLHHKNIFISVTLPIEPADDVTQGNHK